jgi:DNA (cytosine-5)-methyltransferase 1
MTGRPLTIGSLFSGIGGLELGLERGIGNGAHTIWQVEQSEYCRAVLAKHWPDAHRYDDVRTVGRSNLAPVDVLCGGFPCQDISVAGAGAGLLVGTRSGLWFEFERIIAELRPQWVVIENVSAIESKTHRAARDAVLGGLRSLGYGGERAIISAADVGAPHRRDRWFVVAHAERSGLSRPLAHIALPICQKASHPVVCDGAAHPWLALDGDRRRLRSADGLPVRMDRDRIRALGNAVVPQVAEVVGRLIAAREAEVAA